MPGSSFRWMTPDRGSSPISAILVLSAINYRGVTFGSSLQSAFTLVKVLAVLAIMVLGFVLYDPRPAVAPGRRPRQP